MKKHYVIGAALALSLGLTACQGQTGAERQSTRTETQSTAAETQNTAAETENTEAGTQSMVAENQEVEDQEAEGQEAEAADLDNQAGGADLEQAEASGEHAESGNGVLVAYFTYGENAELPDGVDASSSASIQLWNGEVTGNTGLIAHMIGDAAGAELFSIQTVEPYPPTYDATIEQGQAENTANARPELAAHIENFDSYQTIFVGFPNWWYDMPMAMYSFFEEYDFAGKTIIPFCTSGGSGFSGSINTIRELEPEAEVLDGLSIGGSSAAGAQAQVDQWLGSLEY